MHRLTRQPYRSLPSVAVLVLSLLAMSLVAEASDPLRLDERFHQLHLNPFMTQIGEATSSGQVFAIQNGASRQLDLVLQRPPLSDLAVALGLQSGSRPPLRLFSSTDNEFAAAPGDQRGVAFFVPAGEVQSFFLPGLNLNEVVFLWSPEQQNTHIGNRQTFHSTMLLLLAILLAMGAGTAILRRSRRAIYGVTMGFGLMVLLASLWLSDILPDAPQWQGVMRYRLPIIQFGLGLGVFMSVLAHLNLVFRQAVNRNYWTRVIIFADAGLLATGGFWTAEILAPSFAGVLSSELGDIALALTCGTVLLGTIFVPDRR